MAGGFRPNGGLHLLLELRRPFFEIGDAMGSFVAALAFGRDDNRTDTVELIVIDTLDGRDGTSRCGVKLLLAFVVEVFKCLRLG